MDAIVNDVAIFLTSGIGIILQVAAFIAAIIPGIKWMNQKLDTRIDDNIDDKLEPVVKDICDQLTDVSTAMKIYQTKTNTAIKYIDDAIKGLQGINTDREIERYMRDHSKKETDE